MYETESRQTLAHLLSVHPDPSEKATFVLVNADPVKEGDTVTMKCETDGNPQPEFEFHKEVRVCWSCVSRTNTFAVSGVLVTLHRRLCPPVFRTMPSPAQAAS